MPWFILALAAGAVLVLPGVARADHRDCARAWPGTLAEANRAYLACKEAEGQEHREQAQRRAVEEQRRQQQRALDMHRKLLAGDVCQQAGLVGQSQSDCAVIVAPYIDCDPRTIECRDQALAIARQARRQAEQDRQASERDERRTRALEDQTDAARRAAEAAEEAARAARRPRNCRTVYFGNVARTTCD
jgi:hypothetical protein